MGSQVRVLSRSGMILHFKIISLNAVLRTDYRRVRVEADQKAKNPRVMLDSLLSFITLGPIQMTRSWVLWNMGLSAGSSPAPWTLAASRLSSSTPRIPGTGDPHEICRSWHVSSPPLLPPALSNPTVLAWAIQRKELQLLKCARPWEEQILRGK